MEAGDRTARSRATLVLGLRAFAQCVVVLVIVGIAAGWFRPYGHSAKTDAKRHAAGVPKPPPTHSEPDQTPPPVPSQSWHVISTSGTAWTVRVDLRINPRDIAAGEKCANKLAELLDRAGRLELDVRVHHDQGISAETVPILDPNRELRDELGDCAIDTPPASTPSIGDTTWRATGKAAYVDDSSKTIVHVYQESSLTVASKIDCHTDLYVWVRAGKSPEEMTPEDPEFTTRDNKNAARQSLAQVCGG